MAQFKIRELMDAEGYNIKTFSEKTGVSRTTISSFYNGKSSGIQLTTLEKFCSVLNATPNDLIEINPEQYVVILDAQPLIDGQVVAAVYSEHDYKQMLDKNNPLINLSTAEHKLFISKTADFDGDKPYVQLAVGLPAKPDARNANLGRDEMFGLNHWLQTISDRQRIELCRQAAYLFIKSYVDEILQHTIPVSFRTKDKTSRVYVYDIDPSTGKVSSINQPESD